MLVALENLEAEGVDAVGLGQVERDQGRAMAPGGGDLVVERFQRALGSADRDDVRAGGRQRHGAEACSMPRVVPVTTAMRPARERVVSIARASSALRRLFQRRPHRLRFGLVRPRRIPLRDHRAGHQLHLVEEHQGQDDQADAGGGK